mgnify:CR=1 FL=1
MTLARATTQLLCLPGDSKRHVGKYRLTGHLGKWNDLLKTTMRGVDWEWTSTGPDSGQLVMTYTHGRSVSLRSYFSTLPALELGLSLSGKSGTVGEPELLSDQSARFVVRWKG